MSMELRVGMTLRTQKPLTNASMNSFTYFRESAALAKTLPPSSSLKIVSVASSPPIWAKFSLPGYPANATLKLSADEIRNVCGLPATPTLAPVLGMAKYRDQLEGYARKNAIPKPFFEEFMAFFQENGMTITKSLLAANDTYGAVEELFKVSVFLKNIGLVFQQQKAVFLKLSQTYPPATRAFISYMGKNGSKVAGKLGFMGGGAKAVASIVWMIEIQEMILKEQYSQAYANTYKLLMGFVPGLGWAGAVNALQEIVVGDVTPKNSLFFNILRALDPIGQGGAGVDTFVILSQSFFDKLQGKSFNEKRFNELSDRLTKGPGALFAKIDVTPVLFKILDRYDEWMTTPDINFNQLQKCTNPDEYGTTFRQGPAKLAR